MWNVRRRVARELLPDRKVIVRFSFSGVPSSYRGPKVFWLLLERERVELCIDDPGFDIDLYLEADLGVMVGVWLGDTSFDRALRSGAIRLIGPRALAKAFPSWLMLSAFAQVPRPSASLSRPAQG
jgi:hypothetical protein